MLDHNAYEELSLTRFDARADRASLIWTLTGIAIPFVILGRITPISGIPRCDGIKPIDRVKPVSGSNCG